MAYPSRATPLQVDVRDRRNRAPALPRAHDPNTAKRRYLRALFACVVLVGAFIVSNGNPAHAQNATWLTNPGTNSFNTGTNWSTGAVRTGTARFGASNTTTILFQPFTPTTIGTLQFDRGAPAYTFVTAPTLFTSIAITGTGIVNHSANAPTFVVGNQANLTFQNASTAGNANIITNNGGITLFTGTATGGDARLTANAGGVVDISALSSGGMTSGSIAGAGIYQLGAKQLTTGLNNLSTTVSGTITGTGGSLVKDGRGTLTLTGTNTYTGSTTVNAGELIVNGSIASSSSVAVTFGGLLGGGGTVSNVTVGPGGRLNAGNGTPGSTLTITGNLIFAPATLYTVNVNSQSASFANVGGTTTLSGIANVNVGGSFFVPRAYTILSSSGLVLGRFDEVIDNRPSFEAEISYTPHKVIRNFVLRPAGSG
jgi:autotransporter-associated beta strand protein